LNGNKVAKRIILEDKAGTRTICGLNGNKVTKRIIFKNDVAIRRWEVCMPEAIVIVAH
jgi:hypothetical protein